MGSVLLFAFFIWRQRQLHRAPPSSKGPAPVVPKGLLAWKNRNLSVVYIAAFLLWACIDVNCDAPLRPGYVESLKTDAGDHAVHLILLPRFASPECI